MTTNVMAKASPSVITLSLSLITICLSLVIIFCIKAQKEKKVYNNVINKKDYVLTAKDKLSCDDLYYLKHPYLIKGDQLNDEQMYDSAIYYYREASVKFEREYNWENYVWVNGYIARLYLYVAGKNYEDALPYLREALEKGEKNLNSNHLYLAITYYYSGLYYYNKKIPDTCSQMLNKGLEILLKNYKEDNIYIADAHDALGNLYAHLLFDKSAAEKIFLKSVRIKETLPDEENKSGLTSGYYNLVGLNLLIGDYEKAQSYYYEAMKNTKFIKNHKSYWQELLESVLANIYSNQQIFDKAICRLKNAIQINYENKGDKSYVSYYHTSLGDISSKMGMYDSAIIYYKKALKLANTHTLLGDQKLQAATTNYSLGMAYLNLKNFNAAHFYLNKCLNTRLSIYGNKNNETAKAFQGIGSVYKEKGFTDSALKYFQFGLIASTKNFNAATVFTVPLTSTINYSFHSYLIIRDKASMLKQLYNNNTSETNYLYSSMAYYCLADTLMTLFRSGYERETAKLLFSKENISIYEEAIDCATLLYQKTQDARYLDLAFNFMDKRKSTLLLEALNEKELFVHAGIPIIEQDRYRSLQNEFVFLQSQLENENNKKDLKESVLKILHARMNVTEGKLKTLHEKLSNKYAFYGSVQQKNDTVSLKDLQALSYRTNAIILEYFWGNSAVFVLGIYKGKNILLTINRSDELDHYFEVLQADLAKGYVFTTKDVDFISFQKSSYYMYSSLVKPILSTLNFKVRGKNNKPGIIVIPDGPLCYIPFEALVTEFSSEKEVDYKKLNYLINGYAISYGYSARLLLNNYNRQNATFNPAILALSFSKDQTSKKLLGNVNILRKYNRIELPGSASELKAISLDMKGRFYMGDEATESLFKKEAPRYDILHLAVHGEADSLNSYQSRLIFKKGNDTLNDGNLYAYEIHNLTIKAKLAVLSACESGIGKLNQGEGMFSIARGFIYAGCPAVIMSYWRVNDNSTQLIISNFYNQISAGDRIDQSLKKAKLEYINMADRRTAHPANWAAFVATGNMTPLVKEGSFYIPVCLIIMIIISVGTGIYLIWKSDKLKNITNRNTN